MLCIEETAAVSRLYFRDFLCSEGGTSYLNIHFDMEPVLIELNCEMTKALINVIPNVAKHVRNRTAQFRCVFGSTDD